MRISELATITGISIYTIRYYEKQGLISDLYVQRNGNNYRNYKNETVELLSSIRIGKKAGFSLQEIATLLLELEAIGISKKRKKEVLNKKLIELKSRIDNLESICSIIQSKII